MFPLSFFSEEFWVARPTNNISRFHPHKNCLTRTFCFGFQSNSGCFLPHSQLYPTQVSRIALRGNCLFSAGHDGQVNHYAVSYSVSSPGMLVNAEQRHHSSVALPGRHASRECTVPSFSAETVDLTIVTTYATAPVTTVSELWVGGEGNWEAGPRRAAAGSEGQVRVAVAGRSGSSRMSVWDLTEGRQILEVRFGVFAVLGATACRCVPHVERC